MNYKDITEISAIVISFILFAGLIYAGIISFFEKEKRASRRSFQLAFLFALLMLVLLYFDHPLKYYLSIIISVIFVIVIFLFFIPFKGNAFSSPKERPSGRIDERDIMFSRRKLEPGTTRFNQYYSTHPESEKKDEQFRREAGLLSPDSQYYDPLKFSAAEASFTAVDAFHAILDTAVAVNEPIRAEPGEATRFVKNWAKKLGAVSVGVTELKDYHIYSHNGRNEPYGAEIDLNHKYAIAFTVEMDKEMLDFAPAGPTVMESAQQYLNAGAIAVQISQWIKNLGYPARAHIDGNYRVVCPLAARDAGLGEIGRMGLLMTPELGPRVRIGVVTTDLPLNCDLPEQMDFMLDFCDICKKCADVCPSKAISFDGRREIEGVKRWQIDQASCYTYWCKAGTDCGRCVRVCPFSHPDNLLHNTVRFGVKRSWLFRRMALKLDDFFYGRKPVPTQPIEWLVSK